jgi:hypothetical protein
MHSYHLDYYNQMINKEIKDSKVNSPTGYPLHLKESSRGLQQQKQKREE